MQVDAETFRQQVTPACEAATRWARLCVRASHYPASGSPAEAELAVEDALSHPTLQEPVRSTLMQVNLLHCFVLDHLEALAISMQHVEIGPIYAHWSLIRPIVENAPRLAWLCDPTIDAEQRMLRGLVLRLASLGRQAELPPPASGRAREIAKELREMRQQRWPKRSPEHVPRASSAMALVGADSQSEVGELVYRLSSGSMHGDLWALTQALSDRSVDLATRRPVAAIKVESDVVMAQLGTAAILCQVSVKAADEYLGRESQEADAAWRELRAAVVPYLRRPRAS